MTTHEYGEADEEIPCGQYAEWKGPTGVLACSDCYHAHDFADRAYFTYLDDEPVHRVGGEQGEKR